jgi:hypothetical protein
MDWMNQIGGILQQYAGGSAPGRQGRNIDEDFDRTTEAAPREVVVDALTKAFRSDATPAFPEIVSNLFRNSTPVQRSALISTLLKSVGATGAASVLGEIGLSKLGGVFGGAEAQLAPAQTDEISPETVKSVATRAAERDPSVLERIASFYADRIGSFDQRTAISAMAGGAFSPTRISTGYRFGARFAGTSMFTW